MSSSHLAEPLPPPSPPPLAGEGFLVPPPLLAGEGQGGGIYLVGASSSR